MTILREGGEVALPWHTGASPEPTAPRAAESSESIAELARRTRQAWLDCQEAGPLPESVWRLLKLVPSVCHALDRAEAAADPYHNFGRVLAHEIRRRADPLESALERLRSRPAAGPGESSEAAIRELEDLLDNLRRVADGFDHLAEPATLREIATEVHGVHAARATELGVQLTVADLPELPVDAERTRLVLSLLVDNALRHRDPEKPEQWVQVRARRADGDPRAWRIEVADNGTGMSDGLSARLARAAARGLGAEPAAGLGLSICHLAVEQMGGRLGLVSAQGVGTTWFFALREREAAGRG
jgi:signal transduction histidine kinase